MTHPASAAFVAGVLLAGTTLCAEPERWTLPRLPVRETCVDGERLEMTVEVQSESGVRMTASAFRRLGARLELLAGGNVVPPKTGANGLSWEWGCPGPGSTSLRLRVRSPGKAVLLGEPTVVRSVGNTAVRLPPITDFGVIPAGCQPEFRCVPLDLSGSAHLAIGTELQVRWDNNTGFGARLNLRHAEGTTRLSPGTPVVIAYSEEAPSLCYAPPRCEVPMLADQADSVTVTPIVPILPHDAGRACTTWLKLTVRSNTWIECNLWWILIIVGALLTWFVVAGIVRPFSFPSGAQLRIDVKEKGLNRSPPRKLRSVRDGRRGFYRSATCCFDAGGHTVGRRKGHVLMLRASVGGAVAVEPAGAKVERRVRGRWRGVDPTARDPKALAETTLVSGAVYRVNDAFFFRIEL